MNKKKTWQAEAKEDPILNLADMLGGNVDGMLYCSLIMNKHFEAAWTTISTVNSLIVTVLSDISLTRRKNVHIENCLI